MRERGRESGYGSKCRVPLQVGGKKCLENFEKFRGAQGANKEGKFSLTMGGQGGAPPSRAWLPILWIFFDTGSDTVHM
jgi:hypothetical protein